MESETELGQTLMESGTYGHGKGIGILECIAITKVRAQECMRERDAAVGFELLKLSARFAAIDIPVGVRGVDAETRKTIESAIAVLSDGVSGIALETRAELTLDALRALLVKVPV